MQYLFRFEIKGIQSFIFASNKLKEIAGGSAIVDTIFSLHNCRNWGISEEQVLQCAAGAATILFNSKETLEKFVQTFPLTVQVKAPGIELTYAWVPFEHNNETQVVQDLMKALRCNRNTKMVSLPELGPIVLRAGRTGGGVVGAHKTEGQFDRASKIKMDAGRKQRHSLESRVMPESWREIYSFTKGECFEKDGGMVAIIHIDGNDIGKRIINSDLSLSQYQKFSFTMSKITEESTKHAMDVVIKMIDDETKHSEKPRVLQRIDGALELPIRPIIVGGDDCTILIEDKYAMIFAHEYIGEFRRRSRLSENQNHLLGSMEASAGIAFVKAKAPFASNYELADALCGHSKNTLRERCGEENASYTPSAVTFHRVTTSAIPDWRQILQDEYFSEVPNPNIPQKGSRLTAGPYIIGEHTNIQGFYTWNELRNLVGMFANKNIPRGPFREWLRVIQTDPKRGEQRWNRINEVLSQRRESEDVWRSLNQILISDGYPTFVLRAEGSPQEIGSNVQLETFVTPIGDILVLNGLKVEMNTAGEMI